MTLVVAGCRAVLPDRVLDDAVVVADDEGRIVDVRQERRRPAGALDAGGAYLLPGLVDVHSDGLEKEVNPRPGTEFPMGFALRSFEGRLRAAGVTTVFHGVAFEDHPRYGRTVDLALRSCRAIAEAAADAPAIDHRVLHRLDARTPVGLAALLGVLPSEGRALVSIEDHTPGQGQFRDLDRYRETVSKSNADADASLIVEQRILERDGLLEHRKRNLEAVGELARTGRVALLAHDVEDADEVHELWRLGASIAEFPLSLEAARAAHRHHMSVVMGAPNVLRGGSHSGNVAAEPLITEGLCDVLASDYQPSTLLAAAFGLADRGACSLPDAVRLVTAGPASMAGLLDRGRLAEGLRADLVLVDLHGGWPRVRATWRAEDAALLLPV